MKTYRIAVIPGDGIGKEVVPAAIKVLDQAALLDGRFQFEWTTFPWGCEYYSQGIANPIGQIWTGKMMLDFLGYQDVGTRILNAIEQTLARGIKTPDLGGAATLQEVSDAIIDYLT